MTAIYAVNGIKRQIPPNEWADRAANVPARRHVPFASLTEGEMRLHLLDREIEILKGYAPEQTGYLSQLQAAVRNALNAGLHRSGAGFASAVARQNPAVANILKTAMRQTKSAQGNSRMLPRNGAKVAAIGAATPQIIPFRDCSEYMNVIDDGYGNQQEIKLPGYQDCIERAAFEVQVNEYLWKSAHHILYEWLDKSKDLSTPYPNGQRVTPASAGYIASKQSSQRLAVSAVARVAAFSRPLLVEWYALGIKERNVAGQLPPMTPGETIRRLKSGEPIKAQHNVLKLYRPGVGEPISVTIIAIVKLVTILVSAIAATAGLVSAIKSRPQDLPAGFASPEFGPDTLDWDATNGTPDELGTGLDTTTLLMLGGAALLLLDDKK